MGEGDPLLCTPVLAFPRSHVFYLITTPLP
jgi:hypothetical protein